MNNHTPIYHIPMPDDIGESETLRSYSIRKNIECECPLDDEHFVTRDGEPMEAVGWFSLMEHVDFNGFYEPILFDDQYKLLGWGEYLEPECNLRGFDKNNPIPE